MTNKHVPKMPSMKHLPWSEEEARQQKWLNESETEEIFEGEEVVMLEKLDGANACITNDKVYARSHSGEPHREEWDYLKKKHREELMHKIPENIAIFGEYLYARHSIKYESLPSYFIAFGAYKLDENKWLSWDETVELADEIGLPTAPVIKRGWWHPRSFKDDPEGTSKHGITREGYVIRTTDSFKLDNLKQNMAKCVREDHVQTEELHWRKGGEIETNDLQ